MANCSFCKVIKTYEFIDQTDGNDYRPDIIHIKNNSIDGYIFLMADRDYMVINCCPVCGRSLKNV